MATLRIQKYCSPLPLASSLVTAFRLPPLQPSNFSALQKRPPSPIIIRIRKLAAVPHSSRSPLVMKSPTLLLYTTFSFLFFSSALFKTIHRHQNREAYHFSSSVFLPDEQRAADVLHLQQVGLGLGMRGDMEKMKTMGRRFLSEPGSSPPHCISKCGSCTPCKPVRVAVPPGTPVTEEYYPEAWRCKCGNRLYMP